MVRSIKRKTVSIAVLFFCLGCMLLILPFAAAGAADPPGWSLQYSQDNVMLWAVSAVDADTCWAVGAISEVPGSNLSYSSLILKSEDGGATWNQQGPSYPSQLTAVSAIDANVCWVGGTNGIAKTEDGGDNWTVQIYAEGYQVWSLSAVDASTCWGVGSGPTGGFIVKTSDGTNWMVQEYGLPYPLKGVSAVNGDVCWAAGGMFSGGGLYNPLGNSSGNVLKTANGGMDWYEIGRSGCAYTDISALDAQTAWAIGATTYPGYPVAATYPESCRTLDGGASWEVKAAPQWPAFTSGIQMLDADSAWLAGKSGYVWATIPTGGIVYRSDDGGNSWIAQDNSADWLFADISAIDSDCAWAVGSASTYTTAPTVKGMILHTSNGGWQTPPTLISIDPGTGIMGDEITVYGSDFGVHMASSRVFFGSVEAEVVSWTDTQIKCRVPNDLPTGEISVTVNNNGGASNPLPFEVEYATVITGRIYNHPGITVNVYDLEGNKLASGQTGDNGVYRLETTLPAGDYKIEFVDSDDLFQPEWYKDKPDFKSADVYAISGGKLNDMGDTSLSYYPAIMTSITPDASPPGLVLDATIGGEHLREGANIKLEGEWIGVYATDVEVASPDRIDCKFDLTGIPEYLAGPCDLTIGYYDGEGSVLNDAFDIVSTQPVGISSITPDSGAQYTVVNITDLACSGFWGDFTVRLDDGAGQAIAAGDVSVESPTSLACTFDLNGAHTGTYDVVLANPDGNEVMLVDGFNVTPPDPLQLISITPSSSYSEVYVETILDCPGFRPETSVRLEGNGVVIDGTDLVFSYNPSCITCVFDLIGAPPGLYDVVVENPGDGKVMLVDGFEVIKYMPIVPESASQFAMQVDLSMEMYSGWVYQPETQVRLVKGGRVIDAYNVHAISDAKLGCSVFLFGAEPGTYEVLVYLPNEDPFFVWYFTVTSPCGQGSGPALLMLGVTLGLLSLAGSGGWRMRRRNRRAG